jgi:hypothetical protein
MLELARKSADEEAISINQESVEINQCVSK